MLIVCPHIAAIAVLSFGTTFNMTITTLNATSTITNLDVTSTINFDNDVSNHENGSSHGRGLKTQCHLKPYY